MIRRRSITALMAALYVLAAARAAVPGLCQTQKAALEQIEAHACCATECAPASDRPTLHAPAKPRVPCAFCLLAATPTEPPTAVEAPASCARLVTAALATPDAPFFSPIPSPGPGRSPPSR